MGDHRINPKAIEKAMRVAIPPGQEFYDFKFQVVLELNRESMDEVTKAADAAELAGGDPRRELHLAAQQWNPKDHPERFDYVVYNYGVVARPSALLPDPSKIPAATVRLNEHIRMPLTELRKRADDAFNDHEASQRGSLQ